MIREILGSQSVLPITFEGGRKTDGGVVEAVEAKLGCHVVHVSRVCIPSNQTTPNTCGNPDQVTSTW